ncbi:hypothetical protein AGMMS49965_01430 [Bacteroidia bacterium]|nr:hypothetical protein AGMMS49965_01430 [Bacteroidia bacterium]
MLFCSGTALAQTYSFTGEATTGGRIIDEDSTQNGDYPAETSITAMVDSTTQTKNLSLAAQVDIDPGCLPFDRLGEMRYNNVLMIKDLGLVIDNIKWFRNNEVIGTGPYYSAGNKYTDVLDKNAEYHLEITTADGAVWRSCPQPIPLRSTDSSPLQAYPNPVEKSSLISIEGIPKEAGSIIIYDIAGKVVARHDLTAIRNDSETMPIPMPATGGIYLIKAGEKTIKVLVK